MKFLSGLALQEAITSILREPKVRCAVAFWGAGAEKEFSDWTGRDIRVICNLRSGGTNPYVIEKFPLSCVKQNDKLHAKVYIGGKFAVITSANASANGLGLEGSEQSAWIEAGVLTSDLREIRQWFDELWKPKNSKEITAVDLKIAKTAWELRRTARPMLNRPEDIEINARDFLLIWWESCGGSEINPKALKSLSKKEEQNLTLRIDKAIVIEGSADRQTLTPGRWVLVWTQNAQGHPLKNDGLRWVQIGPILEKSWRPTGDKHYWSVALPAEEKRSPPFPATSSAVKKAFWKTITDNRFASLREESTAQGYYTKNRLQLIQNFWSVWRDAYLASVLNTTP